jgi:hydroxypyruvate reductase
VLGLFSGGGSSLLNLPARGITLEDQRQVGCALLRSGAAIRETNVVRRHLSAIQGGHLALACWPARIVTLLISDVPGDDPAHIASGPTVPDATTRLDALEVLERYGVRLPRRVVEHLRGDSEDDPSPGDPRLAANEVVTVATARNALEAAAEAARRSGITPHVLGAALEGEARELGEKHADLARRILREGAPVAPPFVLLSGGETTVTLRGEGRGGRNTEYLLSLAMGLKGHSGIWALAADTDGIDGSGDNAGALCPPDILARATDAGLKAKSFLEGHDSYGFFGALGELVVTGPTLTNVSDFRAILVTDRG